MVFKVERRSILDFAEIYRFRLASFAASPHARRICRPRWRTRPWVCVCVCVAPVCVCVGAAVLKRCQPADGSNAHCTHIPHKHTRTLTTTNHHQHQHQLCEQFRRPYCLPPNHMHVYFNYPRPCEQQTADPSSSDHHRRRRSAHIGPNAADKATSQSVVVPLQ